MRIVLSAFFQTSKDELCSTAERKCGTLDPVTKQNLLDTFEEVQFI